MMTDTTTFAVGDVVQLKSGGPALTVLGQSGDRVHCVFFSDEFGEFRECVLAAVALEAADLDDDEDDEDEDEDGDSDDEDEDDEGLDQQDPRSPTA